MTPTLCVLGPAEGEGEEFHQLVQSLQYGPSPQWSGTWWRAAVGGGGNTTLAICCLPVEL